MQSLYSEDSVLDLPEPEPTPSPVETPEPSDSFTHQQTERPLPEEPQPIVERRSPLDSTGIPLADQEWTVRLVGLLTHLDYYRRMLEFHRLNEDTNQIVEKAEAIVQLTEETARKVAFNHQQSDKLSVAIGKAGAFFTAASSLRRHTGRGLLSNVLNALSSPEPYSSDLIRDYLFSAADTLNSYFSLFTERFSNNTASRRWVDAASAYLAELKQTIRQLPE